MIRAAGECMATSSGWVVGDCAVVGVLGTALQGLELRSVGGAFSNKSKTPADRLFLDSHAALMLQSRKTATFAQLQYHSQLRQANVSRAAQSPVSQPGACTSAGSHPSPFLLQLKMQESSSNPLVAAAAAAAASSTTSLLEQASRLLTLPGPANKAVISNLCAEERGYLRLACKGAAALVDSHTVRLEISGAQLQQGWGRLQRQFPELTTLRIHPTMCSMVDALASPPWCSVTSLRMDACSADFARHMAAAFPSLKQLQVDGDRSNMAWLPSLCHQPPALACLDLWSHELTGQHLAAVAMLTGLTRLTAGLLQLGEQQQHGTALGNMQRLQSLGLRYNNSSQQRTMALDLRQLTALSSLRLSGYSMDDRDNPVDVHMQPPNSLVHLVVDRLPLQALPLLPHLTSLELKRQQAFGQQQLAQVRASLTSLACLSLCTLSLSIVLVTKLVVSELNTASPHGQLGKVFPQLRALTVLHTETSDPPARSALFQGLHALERLDVGCGDLAPGARLAHADFQALAALPALRVLRVNVAVVAIQSVAMLTQLHTLDWVWFMVSYDDCMDAFHSSVPPAGLLTVAISAVQHGRWLQEPLLVRCLAWVALASSVTTIHVCEAGSEQSILPTIWAALAALPNVKRIAVSTCFQSMHYSGMQGIISGIVEQGVNVVVLPTQSF